MQPCKMCTIRWQSSSSSSRRISYFKTPRGKGKFEKSHQIINNIQFISRRHRSWLPTRVPSDVYIFIYFVLDDIVLCIYNSSESAGDVFSNSTFLKNPVPQKTVRQAHPLVIFFFFFFCSLKLMQIFVNRFNLTFTHFVRSNTLYIYIIYTFI